MTFASPPLFWMLLIIVTVIFLSFVATSLWFRTTTKLQRMNNKYRALLESFSDVVFLLDSTGRYIDIIGNKEALLVNRADNLFDHTIYEVMPYEKAVEIHETILKTLELGPQAIEYQLDVPAGKKVFEGRTSVLNQMGGEPPLVVWVSRDITDKKEAEDREKNMKAQLVQAEKMEAIAVTAGGVAHDLNNLLSSIVVYPDIIKTAISEDSEMIPYLEQIKTSGEQAASIVKDLLVLSRKSNRESKLLDINQLILEFKLSSVVEMLKKDHPNVKLVCELESQAPLYIFGSGIHITKVLMNLVINAFEAIEGPGQVTIKTGNSLNGRVFVSVVDDGKGMSEETRQKIFDPFFSDKRTGKSGAGLGLAVVWGITKDHEGSIDVQTTLGQGSCFQLNFPEAKCLAPMERVFSYQNFIAPKKINTRPSEILIADDFEDQREVLEDVLQRLGHQVSVASSGQEAFDQAKERKFDLIVLDMMMGDGWDGLETYKNIQKIHPNQKAVILTGHSDDEKIKQALSIGVLEVATKPMNFNDIKSLVERSTAQ